MGIVRWKDNHASARLARNNGGSRNKPCPTRTATRHARIGEHEHAVENVIFGVIFFPVIQGEDDRCDGTLVTVWHRIKSIAVHICPTIIDHRGLAAGYMHK